MPEHTEICSRDSVGLEASGIEKNFFLRRHRHPVFLTQIFAEKYMAADISGCLLSIKATVLIKEFSVSTAARISKLRKECLWCLDDRERIRTDVFIHSPVPHIVFQIIGKKNDLAACICKIVHDTGIICDQYITGIQYIIGIKV